MSGNVFIARLLSAPTLGAETASHSRGHGTWALLAKGLVYAATLYPFALCFLNTHGLTITNGSIIGVELILALIAVPIALARMTLPATAVLLAVVANFAVIALIQSTAALSALPLNAKPVRDLMMPIVFIALGFGLNDRKAAERILVVLSIGVIAVGLMEFVLPKLYYSVFDTLGFFASRSYAGQYALAVLQERPGGIGRTLLPFLGPRRISSIFIEPVALGNFAIIVAAWGLAKPRAEWRGKLILVVMSAVMIVMCDARFGSLMIILLLSVAATRAWRLPRLVDAFPVLAMGLVVVVALTVSGQFSDNFMGRLHYSGVQLMRMSPGAWLGFPDIVTMDAGYSYIILQAGLVICGALWLVFARMPFHDLQARHFHCNAALYIVAILCISGSSLFALKTGAILWFLLGSVIRHERRAIAEPGPKSATRDPFEGSLAASRVAG